MADATPAAPAAEEPAKKGGIPTILLIANAVLLLGVLGAVAFLALKKPAGAAPPAAEEGGHASAGHEAAAHESGGGHESGNGHGGSGQVASGASPPGAGPTLKLADFVVHLKNPESDRYARFSFEIEVSSDKDKETLTARTAQVRDAFIGFLSDRTVEELRGSAGLDKLKGALFERLAEIAKDCHVRQLYITDFVLQ